MQSADPMLQALAWALATLPLPSHRALWIGARPGLVAPAGFTLEGLQDFRPWVDALRRSGLHCITPDPGDGTQAADVPDNQPLVLLTPARQRDAARAEAARALSALAEGGLLLAVVANEQGAKSFEADLRQLCPGLQVYSKHKCRVLLAHAADRDSARMAEARLLDTARPLDSGGLLTMPLLGAPGLFAVDRVDAGSALLIEHLPATLTGAIADLGSGLGVLSAAALERCPGIRSLDLFEASTRAAALSRHNLRQARVPVRVHCCDVTAGIAGRFEAVLCNPPFHEGARGLPTIGQAFIRVAAQVLAPGGECWLVANTHLPYEQVMTECFVDANPIAQARGFKLLHARARR